MRLVIISDTHELQDQIQLPSGDVLIHAGDLTMRGAVPKLTAMAQWINKQAFQHKIVIAGNHDFCFENANHNLAVQIMVENDITYLQDSQIEIDGIKFWGSPWTPYFYNWAFNLERGLDIKAKWDLIPDDTNVLITHGPPKDILDKVAGYYNSFDHVGCQDLLERIQQLSQLKVHCFGHLHLQGSTVEEVNGVKFVNASICTEQYLPHNLPVVIDL